MKHSYQADCECGRCTKERARRTTQSHKDNIRDSFARIRRTRAPRESTRRATPGSAEWAETRGDDIDSPSGDY